MYMILDDVDSADELLGTIGPEIIDNGYVDVHPIMSSEQQGELFRQWAQQGR
jgi:hypothetical protein